MVETPHPIPLPHKVVVEREPFVGFELMILKIPRLRGESCLVKPQSLLKKLDLFAALHEVV